MKGARKNDTERKADRDDFEMRQRKRCAVLHNERPKRIQAAEIIADHLLENGVIVPPCKVGDTVYIVENPYTYLPLKKVVDGEVVSIHRHEHGLYLRVLFDTKKINGCRDYNLDWCLDKSVFLTKEKAEKALAERSEGK